jgi:hypothetical protein
MKVGWKVRTKILFSGVPQGTMGKIVKIEPTADGWKVAVEWNLERPIPLVNWFTKDEYEQYLEEL